MRTKALLIAAVILTAATVSFSFAVRVEKAHRAARAALATYVSHAQDFHPQEAGCLAYFAKRNAKPDALPAVDELKLIAPCMHGK